MAQTCPKKGDRVSNRDEHLRLARIAAAEGADVVVFPELSLTGYELDLAAGLALAEADDFLFPIVEVARTGNVTMIAGAPVTVGTNLHIGAFIVSPNGSIDVYTKQHLGAFSEPASVDGDPPPPEASVFQPGYRNPAVVIGELVGAVAVCADVGHDSHARRAAGRGANTYLASMFVIPSEFEEESRRLGGYAAAFAMTVAMANFGSPTGGLRAAGRSSIWGESGELLVELPAAGAGVAVATGTDGRWSARSFTID